MNASSQTVKPDEARFMSRALQLAAKAWGKTHPNPLVGAVIVEGGRIVAEGWHEKAGAPHAEVQAIRSLGRKPGPDASLYVTLEPCSTEGRTGACTNALREAGIRRVVVGASDPNPKHAGRGLTVLREAGIEVIEGVLADDCADLNLIFNHWIVTGSPLLAVKMAVTLDGKFAAASGHSKWVTGEAARADVMRWRRYFPAIAVGANTVLYDDPSLTSRIGGEVWCPRRFVFDRSLKTFGADSVPKLYADAHAACTTVVYSATADLDLREKLAASGIDAWQLPERDGHLDWPVFRERCAAESVCGVYVEAGPELATALISGQMIDYVFQYQAPKFIGDTAAKGVGAPRQTRSMEEAIRLHGVRHSVLGDDVLTRGWLKEG